jgi:hypothetical protein
MKPVVRGTLAITVLLAPTGMAAPTWAQLGSSFAQNPIPVNSDNFVRAETDRYFGARARETGLAKFEHRRQPLSIDAQSVIRGNRDTLYSTGVFDLKAGPVTITLPDAGSRFRSMLVITEDGYMPQVVYDAGRYSFTRAQIGTRYVMLGIRTLVDPDSPDDLAKAHSLQDATKIEQPGGPGMFEVPNWDAVSQKKVREALLVLYNMLPDQNRMFGTKEEVDPVRRLIGAAGGWGGNPDKEATYLNVNPKQNDGKIVHRLSVKDVPIDGFWFEIRRFDVLADDIAH